MKLNLKSITLLLAAALCTATAIASDVQYYLSAKGLNLRQTNAGPAIVVTNENPFRFIAEVLASDTNSATTTNDTSVLNDWMRRFISGCGSTARAASQTPAKTSNPTKPATSG